jgi:UDP-glucose 4-epimerase
MNGVSINEIIDLHFKVTGQRVSVNYNHGHSFDVPKIFLDNSRLKSLSSWCPEISLEKGILKMWKQINEVKILNLNLY